MTANPAHPIIAGSFAPPQSSLFAKVRDVLSSTIRHLKDKRAIRRATWELEQLDEHALKDIGLQRGEIEGRVRAAFRSRN